MKTSIDMLERTLTWHQEAESVVLFHLTCLRHHLRNDELPLTRLHTSYGGTLLFHLLSESWKDSCILSWGDLTFYLFHKFYIQYNKIFNKKINCIILLNASLQCGSIHLLEHHLSCLSHSVALKGFENLNCIVNNS